MLHPTINELTKGKFNRYELALATAKCARIITNKYVSQRDKAEKEITGNKDNDKPLNAMIDRELRDEKAVKVAIDHILAGDYVMVRTQSDDDIAEKNTTGMFLDSSTLASPIVIEDDDSSDDEEKSKFRFGEMPEEPEEEG